MKYDYHLIVIGAGSAGLVVASGAAGLGAKVALIEGHKMGGDCLNYGCVPSKAFLKAAHLASDISNSAALGLTSTLGAVDLGAIMDRVQSVISEIEPHDSKERYEGLGVDVFQGYGRFTDAHHVSIDNQQIISGKHCVIATGSEGHIPPIPGLNETPYLTNKTFFEQRVLPKRLVVLGAGPIGLELGQGMAHLGSEVTIVDAQHQLFPKDDPEVGPLLESRLKAEHINFHLGASIEAVSYQDDTFKVMIRVGNKMSIITADSLLVSLGRRPVTENLGLDKVGISTDEKGYVTTRPTLQTSVPSIYACGDVVGPYQFTHMAGYQAGVVIRNTLFPFQSKVDYSTVPWVTYTKPEVAHVGYTEQKAKSLGLYSSHNLQPLASNDRAKTDNDKHGFLKLILGKKNRIIGCTLVGEKAGELLPLATFAVKKKLKSTTFLNLVFPYPTQAEVYKFASLSAAKASFKPWMKRLIKFLFL